MMLMRFMNKAQRKVIELRYGSNQTHKPVKGKYISLDDVNTSALL